MPVAAGLEALTLDGLELNDDVTLGLRTLDAPAPGQRADWVGSADSEYQALFRDPLFENRKITCRVEVAPQSTMDAALDQIALIRDKLAEASKVDDGLPLVWRPANSSRSVTFDVLAGEFTDLPIDWENGWMVQAPAVTLVMTAKPYWRGTEYGNVTDAFGTNSIADYTVDAGAAGNVTITGGVMDANANLTTEDRFVHTASPYNVTDSQVTVKHTLGTTLTSYKAGVILKRIDASNYLEVYVDDTGAASRLRIDQVVATVRTNLVSAALTRMTISTAYWVRARINGNVIVAEHWTAAPTATTTATTTTTATLAGGGATALGAGVSGRAGLVWIPQQTAATLDDFEIAPNVVVSGTAPITTMELRNVPGDAPATVELTVTNTSSTDAIRFVEWGGEQRDYTPASPTSLVVDSDSLVTSGFAGTQTTRTGAYDPNASGNNVIRATLLTIPTAVCGTGTLTHAGRYKVAARVWATSSQVRLRFVARSGDGTYLPAGGWVAAPAVGGFSRVDLGVIDVPVASSGSQAWDGRIEAYSLDTSVPTIDIDLLQLMPADEGYGVSRAQTPGAVGLVTAFDSFTATTAGGALNTRTPDVGAAWATSGAATDFAFVDFHGATTNTSEAVSRAASSTSFRFGVFGSVLSDTQVQLAFGRATTATNTGQCGVIARWVDASNYLRFTIQYFNNLLLISLTKVVAGVSTEIAAGGTGFVGTTAYLNLVVRATGQAVANVSLTPGFALPPGDSGAAFNITLAATDAVLATGGTLDDGLTGIIDAGDGSSTGARWYDGVTALVPPAELPVIYPGRRLEINSAQTLRESAAGSGWGAEQSYRGARPLVPAKGTDNLTSRLAFCANKNDLGATAWDTVTPSYTVQAVVTPRGLTVPRT